MTNAKLPFIFFTNPVIINRTPTLPVLPKEFAMKSLFSDNSLVCYKNHSLASCGVNTVKNSSTTARRT